MNGPSEKELRALVANLESHVDLLEAELSYLHRLLCDVGFPNGLESLKSSAEELLEEDSIGSYEGRREGN